MLGGLKALFYICAMLPDAAYMQRCLDLAQLGKGSVSPNPMVGAVLVYNGRIIGEGWHRIYGEAHAEVNCLENVSEADKRLIPESTMYVSLEPCAHYGKTPPCAVRLVAEGVKKVVICNDDPFEKVDGRGLQILQAGGIETITGLLKEKGLWLNRRFFCFHKQQRPYVILKWAQTANGYFAPYGNKRYQLSNELSTRLVHKWRTEEASIMVGTNTALADDPQLTARLWQGKQPLRLVIDRSLVLPRSLKLFNNDAEAWVFNDVKEDEAGNVRYVKMNFDDNLPATILTELYKANIQSVIIEGGAKLLNSFISKGLWDEARIITANTTLPHGIAAPLLVNGNKAFDTQLETDMLSLYVNNNSAYPYVEGMEL